MKEKHMHSQTHTLFWASDNTRSPKETAQGGTLIAIPKPLAHLVIEHIVPQSNGRINTVVLVINNNTWILTNIYAPTDTIELRVFLNQLETHLTNTARKYETQLSTGMPPNISQTGKDITIKQKQMQ